LSNISTINFIGHLAIFISGFCIYGTSYSTVVSDYNYLLSLLDVITITEFCS